MRLRQTVALLRRDRKIPNSALTQSTADSADRCGECEWALMWMSLYLYIGDAFDWTDSCPSRVAEWRRRQRASVRRRRFEEAATAADAIGDDVDDTDGRLFDVRRWARDDERRPVGNTWLVHFSKDHIKILNKLGRRGGQSARLLLRWSEFESRWSRQFFSVISLNWTKKTEKWLELVQHLDFYSSNLYLVFCWKIKKKRSIS